MQEIMLTDQDKSELLKFLEEYSVKISKEDIKEIEGKLHKKLNHLKKNKSLPSYTNLMFKQIEELAPLVYSKDIEPDMQNKIIAALHYFIWAEDRLPDYIPVVGYLDDAFIISIVHNKAKKHIVK